jgi:RNA polymerase sigma-32 factor
VREEGDRATADTLITSHLRLVGKVAMRYRGYGLPMADVIEEGNVGLMQAVRRFDAGRDCRLATYALWWIKATVQEYVLRSWPLVKLGTTVNQKKLFFGLRRAKSRIAAFREGDLHPDHVAAIAILLGVQDRKVVEMNGRMNGDRTLNAPSTANTAGWNGWGGWSMTISAPRQHLSRRNSSPAGPLRSVEP